MAGSHTKKRRSTGTENKGRHDAITTLTSQVDIPPDETVHQPVLPENEVQLHQDSTTVIMTTSPKNRTIASATTSPKWKIRSTYDAGFLEYSKCVSVSDLLYTKSKAKSDAFKTEFKDDDIQQGQPTYAVGILLKISPPSQVNLEASPYFNNRSTGPRLAKKLKTANTGIKKILLFGCLTDTKAVTFVLLEANNTTHNLFFRNRALDDIKVGTCFAIKSPTVIGVLKSGSYIIETSRPLEMLESPELPIRSLSKSMYQESLRFFSLRNVKIGLRDGDVIVPIQTLCNGKACDRLSAASKPGKPCGCWNQSSRSDTTCKNTVLKQDFCFKDSDNEIHHISDFTSLQWSQLLFEDKHILADHTELQNDKVFLELQKSWKKVITHVNKNGAWTIVGWFKRATVQEDEKQENDANLLVDNVKLNISLLAPTTEAGATIPSNLLLHHDNIRKLCA